MNTQTGAQVIEGLGNVGQGVSAPLTRFLGSVEQLPGGTEQITQPSQSAMAGALGIGIVGAAFSGALVGGVASSDWRGAGTGALVTAGLTALGSGYLLSRSPQAAGQGPLPWLVVAAGAAAVGGSIYFAVKRKGR